MTQPCRHCGAPLEIPFVDLGFAPPSNAYLDPADLSRPEVTYPLRVLACGTCRLVQTEDFAEADALFSDDYAYFSSTSQSWLDHAARYAAMITERLGLGADSHVIEVASNDGYLLRNFVEAGIPCLGVEPTEGTADAARALGIPVEQAFFGEALAKTLEPADLIAGNNVFAHVPDINDFTAGLRTALKPDGVVTLEFPHLLRLVAEAQFDTIYHEHFSYLSLFAVERILGAEGLRVFDVETLDTHGGSLRIYACDAGAAHADGPSVAAMRATEAEAGIDTDAFYAAFQSRADAIKDGVLRFLLDARAEGARVAGYGAAAKGNTLLNYAGIRPDLLSFVCDAAPSKIGRLLPGSHIPIRAPSALREDRPDYILILPWNLTREIRAQLADLEAAGTRFVTAIPSLQVLE
ncbi:methyltransferase domain-containing protein [Jannaschia sp. KMU-145]|uniref:methyltransferase domain-containing protein n=1 Tax=Jannaschia halovivens TaxID=3388667 RepID=UPI00396B114B